MTRGRGKLDFSREQQLAQLKCDQVFGVGDDGVF